MLLPSQLALPLAAILAPLASALPSRSPSAAQQLVQRAPSPEPAGGPSALLRDQLDWSRRQESAPAGGYSLDTSSCGGYNLTSVSQTASGLKAELSMIGEACNAFGIDYERLVLEVDYQSKDRLRVHIYDADKAEYIIPEELFETPGVDDGFDMTTSDLVFNHDPSPFAFWITRANSDAAPIFDTRPASKQAVPDPIRSPGYGGVIKDNSSTAVLNEAGALIFEAGYLEISSALPVGANIVGLSEVVSSSGLWRNSSATVQALWARDAGNPTDQNEYGSFPMYLESRVDGNSTSSHGVFVSSSQGQDIVLRDGVIEYRMLGGSIDFYFVAGPTPLAVHEQMAYVIGRPAMPPYWSLGFHLSRWGYDNITQCREMVDNMRSANIPLEVAWNDIDYMDSYRNWIPAPNRYDPDEFKAYVDELHANHQYYIPIVDAAVAVLNPNGSDVYDPYTRGAELDVFMKNPDGSEYRGQVWPGVTVFPDFFSENTEDWWIEANLNFTKLVDLDGIWLDMNEPSSFCDGSCGSGRTDLENITTPFLLPGLPGNVVIFDAPYPEGYNATLWGTSGNVTINGTLTFNSTPPASVDRRAQLSRRVGAGVDVNTPAYSIHNALPRLSSSTVSPNATHAGGSIQHFDVHNFYGTMMGRATIKALEAHRPGKRPFVVARSLAPGAGRTLAHWTGDNFSKWSSMKDSVRNVLQFSLFGVPMTGADVCGFLSSPLPFFFRVTLLIRVSPPSAFIYTEGNTNEELCSRWMQLGAFHPFYRGHTIRSARPQEPYQWDSVAEASRVAIGVRYALLPYWNKLLWYAHTAGTPLIRAPFYEFPADASLIGVDEQFLIGPDILVTPVLEPNVTEVEGVLPGGDAVIWRDWYDHSVLTPTDGKFTFPAPLGHIPVALKSSSMLLLHAEPSYTIHETRQKPFSLLVSLAADGTAGGTAYVDDGESVGSAFKLLGLSASDNRISATTEGDYNVEQPLAMVTVLGVGQKPERVKFSGVATTDFTYDQATQKLVVKGLAGDLNSAWELLY